MKTVKNFNGSKLRRKFKNMKDLEHMFRLRPEEAGRTSSRTPGDQPKSSARSEKRMAQQQPKWYKGPAEQALRNMVKTAAATHSGMLRPAEVGEVLVSPPHRYVYVPTSGSQADHYGFTPQFMGKSDDPEDIQI